MADTTVPSSAPGEAPSPASRPSTEPEAPPAPADAQQAAQWRRQFETAAAEDVLCWALDRFHPRIALACSFQAEDMVILDMMARLRPGARVFYLDTGLLFAETYAMRDLVARRYDIRLERFSPELSVARQAVEHGPNLWARDPNRCCTLRKVEPLRRALSGLDAWVTGIRRDQTPQRRSAGVVEWDARFGLVKINPLARWTADDVWRYIRSRGVPYNPLHDQGFPSIGCIPCTAPVPEGGDARSGRWPGFEKTECGLHADQ